MKKLLLPIISLFLIASAGYCEDQLVGKSDTPTITISLDLIECAPEKLKEYGFNSMPQFLTNKQSGINWSEFQVPAKEQSGVTGLDKDVRDKLSRLKKDKDIKILYSAKVTTSPDNKVIVDNRQPLEYLTDVATFKKEIAYTGSLFEVKPTITKDGKIVLDGCCWVGELKRRVSNNKDVPEELGWPVMDIRSVPLSVSLENGETIVMGGFIKDSQTTSRTSAGDIIKKEKKAAIYCIGADINYIQNAPSLEVK